MSCLVIQGSLLFAASNSKAGDKKSKSVLAAAAPASAAAAAASTLLHESEFSSANEFALSMRLMLQGPILVETLQPLACPVPNGYRAFGCHSTSLHQHFCKATDKKEAHEFSIMSVEQEKKEIEDQTWEYLWKTIIDHLQQQKKIEPTFSFTLFDYCKLSGKKVRMEPKIICQIEDDIMPHRPGSPILDGYEVENTIGTTQECDICPVRGAAHKHFKKK